MVGHVDEKFANDIRAALDKQGITNLVPILFLIAAMLIGFIAWAKYAVLQEVTSGLGKVIPSSQMQLVQPFEAGIVNKIAVHEGDIVQAGQVLLELDDTEPSSQLGELTQRAASLNVRQFRLNAEAKLQRPKFDELEASDLVHEEKLLHEARMLALEQEQAVIEQQLEQKVLQANELDIRIGEFGKSILLVRREVELSAQLFKRKAIPELDFLQRQRASLAEERELQLATAQLPTVQASIRESEANLINLGVQFKAQAREEFVQTIGEIAVLDETIKAARERVTRTIMRAPVKGIVNALPVTTIGAVIRPGENVVEIVPIEEKLLVEVRISPKDVAFISPEQKVSIKVTAYDYTIYGDIPGIVKRIGADTTTDENGESYYRVTVETLQNFIVRNNEKLILIPGMVVTADILTGQKTVLDYLLKPITKARYEAARER